MRSVQIADKASGKAAVMGLEGAILGVWKADLGVGRATQSTQAIPKALVGPVEPQFFSGHLAPLPG